MPACAYGADRCDHAGHHFTYDRYGPKFRVQRHHRDRPDHTCSAGHVDDCAKPGYYD